MNQTGFELPGFKVSIEGIRERVIAPDTNLRRNRENVYEIQKKKYDLLVERLDEAVVRQEKVIAQFIYFRSNISSHDHIIIWITDYLRVIQCLEYREGHNICHKFINSSVALTDQLSYPQQKLVKFLMPDKASHIEICATDDQHELGLNSYVENRHTQLASLLTSLKHDILIQNVDRYRADDMV